MEKFPHLNFIQKVTGKPRLFPSPNKNPRSEENRNNRKAHSQSLHSQTKELKDIWFESVSLREEQGLPTLDENVIPVFLQLNPIIVEDTLFSLEKFGIEIISEEEDGLIIGVSFDRLQSLEEKIRGFIDEEHGSGKIADLWQIISGNRKEWRQQHILSQELLAKWPEIQDDVTYKLEVSLAFDKPLGREPDPDKRGGEKRYKEYLEKLQQRDDLRRDREAHFENFISYYGSIQSGFVDLDDSFACEVEISGKGLKDLVLSYPYVFEVLESEEIAPFVSNDKEVDLENIEFLPPEDGSPEIGIIDSGLMEAHKYLEPAITKHLSTSYLKPDASTADHVPGGGHGTRVAGALLYPSDISGLTSPYQLEFFIRNLRVLDADCKLEESYPAELMQRIVNEHSDCSIFNLSINSTTPFRKKHMSAWAAVIDHLVHEQNLLFVISAGNIDRSWIKHYLKTGNAYPSFMEKPNCSIANPSQSCFALTVGSINHFEAFENHDWKSVGGKNEISSFSRTGPGIWDMVKPDVVEFGGGLTVSKNGIYQVRESSDTCREILRSNLGGGGAFGKDAAGTSYSAPRVSYLAGHLRKLYPEENSNLIRALIVQGARLPNGNFYEPNYQSLRFYGYGLPSLERVTRNNEKRITFYNTGFLKVDEAHLYSLKIPNDIRSQANEYEILIEVTLAYSAKVRRTRQRTRSYLATWLDWTSSKLDESYETFAQKSLVLDDEAQENGGEEGEVINWKIRERKNWGEVENMKRQDSSVQKDWAILKAYQLPEEISFAVRAHKGWDKNHEEVPYGFCISLEVMNANVSIYEEIRLENEIEIEIDL